MEDNKNKTAEIVERYKQRVALEEAIQNMAHAQARVIAKKKFNTSNVDVIRKIAAKVTPSIRAKVTNHDHNSFFKGTPIKNKGQEEYAESVNARFNEAFPLLEFPQYDTSNAVGQKVDKPIASGKTNQTVMTAGTKKSRKSGIVHYNKFSEECECESPTYKAIKKKSKKSGIDEEVLGEVYDRGMEAWSEETGVTQQQYAFARVNSFINKGKTFYNEDADLQEKTMKGDDPCWKGYEMVGTKKKGGKEVPNCVPVKEEKEDDDDDVTSGSTTLEKLAKKHNVHLDDMRKALKAGIRVEMEHTTNRETAAKIALVHLKERPDYYQKLKKVEESNTDEREDVQSISRPQAGKRGGIKNVERKPKEKLATDPDSAHNREQNIKKKVIESKEPKGNSQNDPSKRLQGTDSLVKAYKKDTPLAESLNESFSMAFDYQGKPTLAPTARDLMMQAQGGFAHHNDVQDVMEVTSIKKELEAAFQATVLEEDKEELAISYEKLTVMVAEAFQTIEKIKSANIERDAWSQAEILKLERYIESVAAYLNNMEEEVKAADRQGEVIPAHKRIITDPASGRQSVVNVPGFTRSAPTEKKIIKSGNIHDGKPKTSKGLPLGPA